MVDRWWRRVVGWGGGVANVRGLHEPLARLGRRLREGGVLPSRAAVLVAHRPAEHTYGRGIAQGRQAGLLQGLGLGLGLG